MSHFAEVIDGIVTKVIVAEQEFIDILPNKEQWIQTSYNTFHGVNYREGGIPLRMNYAGIGYNYDSELDAFIPPKEFDSWTFDESVCDWIPPTPYPDDGKSYRWNEELQEWDELTI